MIKKLFVSAVAGVIVLAACKKNDSPTTVQGKVLGTWNYTSYNYVELDATGNVIDAGSRGYQNGSNIQFMSDGVAYSYANGQHDTSTYRFLNDQTIISDSHGTEDTFNIKTLTANTFIMTQHQPTLRDTLTLNR
jgi:hypothetical protein